MKITAVDDKIVTKQLVKNMSKGGIIITTGRTEPQNYGKVISVGDKVPIVKVGDLIIYHQKGGMALVLDQQLFQVVKNDEVYAIIDDADLEKQLSEVKLGEGG